jgi:hypothetical protein
MWMRQPRRGRRDEPVREWCVDYEIAIIGHARPGLRSAAHADCGVDGAEGDELPENVSCCGGHDFDRDPRSVVG